MLNVSEKNCSSETRATRLRHFFTFITMVKLSHTEQKSSTVAGSIPGTFSKVDSVFHSPDGVSKMNSMADGHPA